MILSRTFGVFSRLALIACLVVLVGCDDTGVPPPVVDQGPASLSYIQMAPTAPPPPRDEAVPDPNNVRTELWRPGYWSYNGAGFDWVSGQMMARPSPTAVWSPDHWIEHTYGWAFEPGYWQ